MKPTQPQRRPRKGLLASRMNTIYSLPMLIFMVGTSTFPYDFFQTTGATRGWIIWIVIWGVLELNALGLIGRNHAPGNRVIYDNHRNAIVHGLRLLGGDSGNASGTSCRTEANG